MRISGYRPPMPAPDMADQSSELDNEIAGALLEKDQNQAKAEGNAALTLIDSAAGVNRPLSEGPVGRLINLKI